MQYDSRIKGSGNIANAELSKSFGLANNRTYLILEHSI